MNGRLVLVVVLVGTGVVALASRDGGSDSGFAFGGRSGFSSDFEAFETSSSAPATTIPAAPSEFTSEFTDGAGYRYEVTASNLRVVTDLASAKPGKKNLYLQGTMTLKNITSGRDVPYYMPSLAVIYEDRSDLNWMDAQKECNYEDWPFCLLEANSLEAGLDYQRNLTLKPGQALTYEVSDFDLVEPLEVAEDEPAPPVVAFVIGLGIDSLTPQLRSFSPDTGEPDTVTADFVRSLSDYRCEWSEPPEFCSP